MTAFKIENVAHMNYIKYISSPNAVALLQTMALIFLQHTQKSLEKKLKASGLAMSALMVFSVKCWKHFINQTLKDYIID